MRSEADMVDRAPAAALLPKHLEEVTCNLCGGCDEAQLFVKESLRIVRCRQCGLVYVNPRLPQSEIAQQYNESYYTAGSYPDYLGERAGYEQTFERRLVEIERLVPPSRILDVGCAFGFFLNVAEKRGWEAHGIDLSPVGCRYATEQLGLRATCCTLDQAGFPSGFFDVVIMNDTFEHLADPTYDLRQAWQVLRPGGFLFLVTQDSSRLIVRLLGRRWAQYKPREHLYYFAARTLRGILEKTGFHILRIEDEGLVCTVDFLMTKLGNISRPAGRVGGWLIRRFGLGSHLVFVRTGYEVMVCAQKI